MRQVKDCRDFRVGGSFDRCTGPKLTIEMTAEGRLQGLVLTILPVFVFVVMLVINRSYALVLFDHVPLLIATGVSMLLGTLWIRRIVNLDV